MYKIKAFMNNGFATCILSCMCQQRCQGTCFANGDGASFLLWFHVRRAHSSRGNFHSCTTLRNTGLKYYHPVCITPALTIAQSTDPTNQNALIILITPGHHRSRSLSGGMESARRILWTVDLMHYVLSYVQMSQSEKKQKNPRKKTKLKK